MADEERRTAQCFPVGEFIAEEAEAIGISLNDLAIKINVHPVFLTELMQGTKHLSDAHAMALSVHLGSSADYWRALDHAYVQWKTRRSMPRRTVEVR